MFNGCCLVWGAEIKSDLRDDMGKLILGAPWLEVDESGVQIYGNSMIRWWKSTNGYECPPTRQHIYDSKFWLEHPLPFVTIDGYLINPGTTIWVTPSTSRNIDPSQLVVSDREREEYIRFVYNNRIWIDAPPRWIMYCR